MLWTSHMGTIATGNGPMVPTKGITKNVPWADTAPITPLCLESRISLLIAMWILLRAQSGDLG